MARVLEVREKGLTIPGMVSPTSLCLPERLSFEQWEEVVNTLGMVTKSCLWWWGDALVYGERKWGERYAQALDASDYEYQTLANAHWVASKIPFSLRRENLSFSHHSAVAALESKQADALLAKAEEEDWTYQDLRREVQKRKNFFNPQPLPSGLFDVILADPPWRYDFSETECREVENQYPTLPVEEICDLNLPFAADAVLFMWATAPKLREAMQVLDAWEFNYKTHAVWCKDKIGMGYWFRGQHELLLAATKGNWSPPPPELRQSSWIEAPRARHSEKPSEVYDLIERMFPSRTNRLELFARSPREGWESWGNESL
jgi:N6-adenosine-specific RNA methylase IME4